MSLFLAHPFLPPTSLRITLSSCPNLKYIGTTFGSFLPNPHSHVSLRESEYDCIYADFSASSSISETSKASLSFSGKAFMFSIYIFPVVVRF